MKVICESKRRYVAPGGEGRQLEVQEMFARLGSADFAAGRYRIRLLHSAIVQYTRSAVECTSTIRLTGATGSPVLEVASSARSQFKLSSIAYTSGEKVEDEPRRVHHDPSCVDMYLISDLQHCTASSMSTVPWCHKRRVNLRPREGGMSGSLALVGSC